MDVDLDPEPILDINHEHVSRIMRKISRNYDLRDLIIIAGVDKKKCVHCSLVD